MGDPWPDVRKPLREGWQGPAPDGVRRSTMDDGTTKKRVASSAIGAVEAFTLKLTDSEAALVRAHWDGNKALRFAFPHPVWGAVEAEYDSPPVFSEKGLFRFVQLRLEIFS
ncbi:MAG TPA: hypothetical protein VEA80_06530 [Vitreimonas sp.]|uniref:hypothetical protein n=1 Tax=Vitreimonas sp. TaxID=3069702 RepID=UPI002D2CE424|nr:hypothetical protein [Vitreimonas sp.]HYD87109.1 hypothetical protein [Vitreimonas sp.]